MNNLTRQSRALIKSLQRCFLLKVGSPMFFASTDVDNTTDLRQNLFIYLVYTKRRKRKWGDISDLFVCIIQKLFYDTFKTNVCKSLSFSLYILVQYCHRFYL